MENDKPNEIFFVSDYKNYTDIMNKLSVYLEESEGEDNLLKCCYNFNAEKNRITALDGYRIGMCNPSESVGQLNNDLDVKEINLKREFWIKLKNCIAKETKGKQNCVYMSSTRKKTYISGNDFMMIVRNVDIKYFNVDKMLLLKSDLMTVSVNTLELNESAEYNISFHGKGSKKPMIMKFIENNIMSYMATESGESFDKISVSDNSVSEEFMIAFNPLFIKELCTGIDTEYMRMGFYNAKSPVMVYDGDFTYLILPVGINGNSNRIDEKINKLMGKVA